MLYPEGDDSRLNYFEEGGDDATHQVEQAVSSASTDPLQIPSVPITRARAKRFKEALNELIQDMWAKQMGQESIITKKELTMIQGIIYVKDQVAEGFWAKDNAN